MTSVLQLQEKATMATAVAGHHECHSGPEVLPCFYFAAVTAL